MTDTRGAKRAAAGFKHCPDSGRQSSWRATRPPPPRRRDDETVPLSCRPAPPGRRPVARRCPPS